MKNYNFYATHICILKLAVIALGLSGITIARAPRPAKPAKIADLAVEAKKEVNKSLLGQEKSLPKEARGADYDLHIARRAANLSGTVTRKALKDAMEAVAVKYQKKYSAKQEQLGLPKVLPVGWGMGHGVAGGQLVNAQAVLLPHYDAKIARLQKMVDTPEVQAKLAKARAKRDEAFSPDRIERDGKTVHRSLVEKASRVTAKKSKPYIDYQVKAADRKRVKRQIAQLESTVAKHEQALAGAQAKKAMPAKVSLFSRLSNFVRGGVSPEYAAKSNKAQAVKNAETEKAAAEEALAIKRFESTILKSEKKAMREANPELNALRKPKAKVATEAAE